MFCLYIESQQEIFNPCCRTSLLLKNIRSRCNCDNYADIELSDEAGNVKNLRDPGHQQRYASDFLEERETLVLLTVEKSHSDPPLIMYKPLLQAGDGVLSEEFLARLALKGTEIQKKRIRSSKRRDTSANVTEQKDVTSRQVSREKNVDKTKSSSKSDKRNSARSKR
ncbi:uncharacterized protein LOC127848791 isoform X2 [Dreissena polymorpha]|uniref:uncharacterized protein LOC127848791 isoform X2 n=1 Tax=Dreissena polymorpha TaxID=45954 RepID=UPI002265327E|nr:uncharacterized protein LOC127848791 isoform X2 [Dreissena polymorpha]